MKLSSFIKFALVNSFLLLSRAEKYNLVVLPSEYGGTDAAVVIDNGSPIKMKSSVNGLLWSVQGDKPSTEYYYVVLNGDQVVYTEKENFSLVRKWTIEEKESLNQVFGRKYDKAGDLLKTIPRIYPAPESYKKYSKLFQEGEVPVVRVLINESEYVNSLLNDSGENEDKEYVGTLDVITPDSVFQFTNVTLSLSGMGSRGYKKRPFKINLSEGEGDLKSNTEMYNRSSFKLRSCIYDESFIKNKMAVDMAASLGLPSGQASHARLYINNDPFGLYELSENLKKKFLRIYYHPGEKKKDITLGSFYKGTSTKDQGLSYQAYLYPEPKELFKQMYDTNIVRQGAADPLEDINEVINWIDGLNEKTPESEIKAKFNVDMFLKYMALEYLICQWDGYLLGGNNFYIYRKVDGTFSLMSFDFDLTFGKWKYYPAETEFHNFAISKKDYGSNGPTRSQLYNKLLAREPFKTQLKKTIDEIVSKLYNTDALTPRVNYFKEFLSDDIKWEVTVRPKLKTTLYEGYDVIDDITYDLSMSILGSNEADDGESSILGWVKKRSEFIAKSDGLTLKADFSKGEVGGVIVVNKEGDSNINGETVSESSKTIINNYFSLIIIAVLTLFI